MESVTTTGVHRFAMENQTKRGATVRWMLRKTTRIIEMKEHPILFSAPMVRAILAGRKTQTRRVVKLPLKDPDFGCEIAGCEVGGFLIRGRYDLCKYGAPGDRLWVKETFKENDPPSGWLYRATHVEGGYRDPAPWKPSIFMPRAASRITLEIVRVRVERLNDISVGDAVAEGMESVRDEWMGALGDFDETLSAVDLYEVLWESINGVGSWKKNPWVCVLEFKRVVPK